MKLVLALFLGLVAADDTTAVWGLTSTNSEKDNYVTQVGFGNYATDMANARPPMRSHVQILDEDNNDAPENNEQLQFVTGMDPEEFMDEEINIKGEMYRFLQKKNKGHRKHPVGVRFIQEREDPPAKPAGYESVDDEAEKVSVPQTPIAATRTTFYNQKEVQPQGHVNLQLDSDLKTLSDPICNSAGCTQYKHKKKDRGYKIDYFVPHFGADTDINDTKTSLAAAEEIVGHKFDFPNDKWKKGKVVKYDDYPTMDHDVIDTMNNLE